ncbi:MAG: sulfotransferase domain-containing protein [Pseudomonadota bacterium]
MQRHDYLFLLGAPKSGTTSVAHWLGGLEDTVLSRRKETLYFTDYAQREWSGPGAGYTQGAPKTLEDFYDQFSHEPDANLRIEASTDTLSCASGFRKLLEFRERPEVRSVKILAVLRDPVERIVSEFEHTLRFGWQKPDLLASLRREDERRSRGWHPLFYHVFRSRYADQLAAFQAAFGKDLLIVDYLTLGDPQTMKTLADFAGRPLPEVAQKLERRNEREVFGRPELARLTGHGAARKLARLVVPKPLRAGIRNTLRGARVERIQPSAAEIAFIMGRLRDDIEACLRNPAIPTENWTCRAYL